MAVFLPLFHIIRHLNLYRNLFTMILIILLISLIMLFTLLIGFRIGETCINVVMNGSFVNNNGYQHLKSINFVFCNASTACLPPLLSASLRLRHTLFFQNPNRSESRVLQSLFLLS
ncbi:hypothetical protein VNO80_24252 [Phaseolus coccineus]|uniref:Uncharacterized protein n=1 Tax=Phaseolus coccineus TaxID=3886 RepID=A0AAN9LSK2_PHACN